MTCDANLIRRIVNIYDKNNAGYPITNDAQKAYVVECVCRFLPSAATDAQIFGALRRARPEILNGTFQTLGKTPLNTRIEYLYRDADNFKKLNVVILNGCLTDEQKAVILDSLDDGEYFVPSMVGLPEHKFDTYDPQSDHPFFELSGDGFINVNMPATTDVTPDELTEAFLAHKGHWNAIEPARAEELLRLLVDDLAASGTKSLDQLLDDLRRIGFSESELTCLGFET